MCSEKKEVMTALVLQAKMKGPKMKEDHGKETKFAKNSQAALPSRRRKKTRLIVAIFGRPRNEIEGRGKKK